MSLSIVTFSIVPFTLFTVKITFVPFGPLINLIESSSLIPEISIDSSLG